MNVKTPPTPDRRWPALLAALLAAEGKPGSGAGELNNPRGIAADPATGHVYVSDLNNSRISEFTAWGLFVKAWGWGVANGSAELQSCGPAQPEASPPPSLCQAGIAGSGKGQLSKPLGVTVDKEGNVWVYELGNLRAQKFSPQGQFLLMVGGDVNKTKVEGGGTAAERNLCPVDPGDVCQAGIEGTGQSHFTATVGNYIDYSKTADAILVGDKDRIQVFNLNGSFKEEIPFQGELEAFNERSVRALDVDGAGNIYLILSGLDDVYKLSEAGAPLEPGKPGASKFKAEAPIAAVAVDSAGDVYTGDEASVPDRILEYDAAGNRLLPTAEEEKAGRKFSFPYLPPSNELSLFGLATNLCAGSEAPGNLYLTAFLPIQTAYLEGYGTGPVGCEPPPAAAPTITAQYAIGVGEESARVRAEINPHFWKDATYYVEYGTGKCAEGGCPNKEPLPPGAGLTAKAVNKAVKSAGILLAGLAPGTTYHFRFVAKSGGGGPVYGSDPDGAGPGEASFEEGTEASFRTFPAPSANPPCANEALRGGAAAKLADCRAYELVSPLDKANGDAALVPFFYELNQSSPTGDRFTYSSFTPFAEPESAPYISQYLSQRDPSTGWRSESISPPRSARALEVFFSLNNEYKAFTPDLCTAWLRHNSDSTLAEGAIGGYPNLYRRESCGGTASYEALSTAKPPSRPAEKYIVEVMGYADEDPSKAIFVANDALTPDAPALPESKISGQKELQLYEHTASGLHFICHLPSGAAWSGACAAGMAAQQPEGKGSSVQNAISRDGSEVFWTAYKGTLEFKPRGIPGRVFVRLNPEAEQSEGAGCEEGKACTVAVSGSMTEAESQFWGASDDGSKAIFAVVAGPLKGNLYEFDVESRTPRLIAAGVEGPMGMSEDAGRIYFASTEALAAGGKAGAHNLYLYEAPREEGAEGSFRFIMALTGGDLIGSEGHPSAINEVTSERSATVSADGLEAAFSSGASPTPTGYDNRDAESGQADEEAYLYDAREGKLRCVSCNPSGARPAGAVEEHLWRAARLPNRRAPLEPPHPLAENGKRLFFESHEALVPRDSNGTWDVYEWEAPGEGSCDQADASFSAAAEGCIELISSGESAAPSRFLDADASGANVFIGTQSSLVAGDFGSNDVYDARIGGGFPPSQAKSACEGEACQNPPGPPGEVIPASAAFKGAGNVRKHKRCRHATHRVKRHGKARCGKKAKHRRAHQRRGGR